MEMGNNVGASQYIEYADIVYRFAQEGKPGFLTCCKKRGNNRAAVLWVKHVFERGGSNHPLPSMC